MDELRKQVERLWKNIEANFTDHKFWQGASLNKCSLNK
jgi:hypothetical protein